MVVVVVVRLTVGVVAVLLVEVLVVVVVVVEAGSAKPEDDDFDNHILDFGKCSPPPPQGGEKGIIYLPTGQAGKQPREFYFSTRKYWRGVRFVGFW